MIEDKTLNDMKEVYVKKDFDGMTMQSISVKDKGDDTIIEICAGGVCIMRKMSELVSIEFSSGGVSIVK